MKMNRWLALAASGLAAAALLDSGLAQAQVPGGSYAQSCSNATVGGNVLRARCRTMAGAMVDTQLTLPCNGSIDNINGRLTCTGAPVGNVPPGSYLQSCGNARVQNNVLYADCRRANQTVAQAALPLPCGSGRIDNLNGVLTCVGGAPVPTPAPAPSGAPAIVAKFAPLLRYDSGAGQYGYPMSADTYFQQVIKGGGKYMQNTDPNTIKPGNRTPVYYTVRQFGGQTRIRYWIFYGYQAACANLGPVGGEKGTHNGDWEDVTVILTQDQQRLAAVQFGQHGGRYLRISGPRDAPCTAVGSCAGRNGFELAGTHPVAYIGRTAHGTFHDSSGGLPSAGQCAYYGDSRDGRGPSMETWGNLVSLDKPYHESWMTPDYSAGNNGPAMPWGPDGVNTHPTAAPFPTSSCTGSALDPTGAVEGSGCYKSECLSGDDEAIGNCLKECEPGYTNTGLTCTKFKLKIFPTSVYGRLDSGKHYGYSFGIPQTDAGLARRRNSNEYNLP